MPFVTLVFLAKTFLEQDVEKLRHVAGILKLTLAALFDKEAGVELNKFINGQ